MNRMNTGRIPKQILRQQTKGQRSMERPMKRWEENIRPQQATCPNTRQEDGEVYKLLGEWPVILVRINPT
jgi:hypothetical protein